MFLVIRNASLIDIDWSRRIIRYFRIIRYWGCTFFPDTTCMSTSCFLSTLWSENTLRTFFILCTPCWNWLWGSRTKGMIQHGGKGSKDSILDVSLSIALRDEDTSLRYYHLIILCDPCYLLDTWTLLRNVHYTCVEPINSDCCPFLLSSFCFFTHPNDWEFSWL